MSIKLGSGFRLTKQGKVEPDHAAREKRLDLCTRLKRRNSKKIRVVKKGQS